MRWHLGNFHLDVFDHWAKQRQKITRYLRSMDDLLQIVSTDDAHSRALPAQAGGGAPTEEAP